jgi:hypothetical protein
MALLEFTMSIRFKKCFATQQRTQNQMNDAFQFLVILIYHWIFMLIWVKNLYSNFCFVSKKPGFLVEKIHLLTSPEKKYYVILEQLNILCFILYNILFLIWKHFWVILWAFLHEWAVGSMRVHEYPSTLAIWFII